MWKYIGLAFLPLLAAPAAAQKANEAADRSFVLVRLTSSAEMIGFPAVCPGSSPEEDQSQIICMAELYEADVRVIRHLGGPEVGPTLRVRFTAHSFHAVWRRGVTFALGTFPFEDQGNSGHFAFFWDWERDGEMCQAEDNLDDVPGPLRAFYQSGPTRMTGENEESWSEDVLLHCAALD